MSIDEDRLVRGPRWSTEAVDRNPSAAAPVAAPGPVRWSVQRRAAPSRDGSGGEQDVTGPDPAQGLVQQDDADEVHRGWVVPPGGRSVDALFALDGTVLSIRRADGTASTVRLRLQDLLNLDAIGDPSDGLQPVEMVMADQRVIGAGWTEEFCALVVGALQATVSDDATPPLETPSDTPSETPSETSSAAPDVAEVTDDAVAAEDRPIGFGPVGAYDPEAAVVAAAAAGMAAATAAAVPPTPAAPTTPAAPIAPEPVAPATTAHAAPSQAPTEAAAPLAPAPTPVPAPDPAAVEDTGPAPLDAPAARLELEDVVYLGGYPGQPRRRKKCVATLSREAIEIRGAGGTEFRIGWDVVRSIEVQNSDEARFRMNTKIHRDASALVLECDQDVTVLFEARDCPTIALRSAIGQLLDGVAVTVA